MNARRILCRLGFHDLTDWVTLTACEKESDHIHQSRLCQRCRKRQYYVTYKDTGKSATYWGVT